MEVGRFFPFLLYGIILQTNKFRFTFSLPANCTSKALLEVFLAGHCVPGYSKNKAMDAFS